MTATLDTLKAAFNAADAAWKAKLAEHFGDAAEHFHYGHQGQIGPFEDLYAARKAARDAWEAAAFAGCKA